MTNKPSDIEGELDKITEKVIYDCGGNIWYDFNDRIKNPGIDEAKAALKALFKREMEREKIGARIEELEHISGYSEARGVCTTAGGGKAEPVEDRLSEQRAALKKYLEGEL